MASLSSIGRLAVKLSARNLRQDAKIRGFCSSAACRAAQSFTMPALSPTMTEGNIAKWNFKEGESFTAGDVLLEIETDKASMDVEAQDDGVVAKIIKGDGSKGIKVGTRIGVLAEAGDDISALEALPEELAAKSAAEKQTSEQPAKASPEVKDSSNGYLNETHFPQVASSPAVKQKYPLLPSVEHLIRLHGIDHSAIDKITPSGPNNRLLKGDVLSYIGKVNPAYPTDLSTKIKKLSHLDLSNIKIKAPEPAPTPVPAPAKEEAKIAEALVNLEVPISFGKVRDVQERVKSTLGVDISDNTFLSRATAIANKNLPRPRSYQPSADELFNSVLGIKSGKNIAGVNGNFSLSLSSCPSSKSEKIDIIDSLSAKSSIATNSSEKQLNPVGSDKQIVKKFNLTVPKAEEETAKLFLSKVKTVLESQPASLVL